MDLAKELLSRYTQEYALDENTRIKAEELYREYISKTPPHLYANNENQHHLVMRIAILVSSRCQEYKTIDNITVRGADLSVTQFLRGNPEFSIDDFAYNLGLFIEQVHLDSVVISDCNLIMKEFTQALTVFNKFEDIWNKIGIKDKSLNKASAEKIRKLAWLIFIIAKVRILQRRGDLVESAYILVAVFIICIQLLPEDVTCELIQNFKRDNQIENPIEVSQSFTEYLIQYFKQIIKAQDADPIILSRDTVHEMLIKLKQKGMIKGLDDGTPHSDLSFIEMELECQLPSKCLHNIMSSDNLISNFKKLDQFYQQKLQPTELDDRHFINTDHRNITPCKLSPFARNSIFQNKQVPNTPQKNQNQEGNTLEPPNKRVLHSKRLLNYENPSNSKMENSGQVTLEQKLYQINFPNRVPNSPYSIKQITPATPISMMMELKTWLTQNLNRVSMHEEFGVSKIIFDFINPQNLEQKANIAKSVSQEIESCITKVIDLLALRENRKDDQRIKDIYYQQYGKSTKLLTFRILDELLIREQRTSNMQNAAEPDFSHLLSREIFLRSAFMCAVESVFFINMVKQVQINDLLPLVGLQAFDLWRLLHSFFKFDQQMPKSLIDHFRQIEQRIVSESAWASGSSVVEIIRKIFREQSQQRTSEQDQEMRQRQENVMQSYHMFFKRVLHVASQRVFDLGKALNLNEDVLEKIWIIMKLLLGHETQLLMNRHLDQLVMCTLFCVCRVHPETTITFVNIIDKYVELNREVRNMHNVYMHVVTNDGVKKDIIKFYNEVYIRVMKEYIPYIKPNFTHNQQANDQPQGSKTPQVSRAPMLTPSLNKPAIKFLCPQSPLRQSMPLPAMQYNTIYQQNVRSNHGTPLLSNNRYLQSPLHPSSHMTPRTHVLFAYGESATSELDKIQSVFKRVPTQGGTGFLQPPPIGSNAKTGVQSQSIKDSIIQNIKNKQSGLLVEPQIFPTIQRNNMPKITGIQPSINQSKPQIMLEPRINIQPSTIMAGIASLTGLSSQQSTSQQISSQQSHQRKPSDQQMSESPTINVSTTLTLSAQIKSSIVTKNEEKVIEQQASNSQNLAEQNNQNSNQNQ